MSLKRIKEVTRRFLATFLREQAEMSAKTEIFMAEVPWRTEQ